MKLLLGLLLMVGKKELSTGWHEIAQTDPLSPSAHCSR